MSTETDAVARLDVFDMLADVYGTAHDFMTYTARIETWVPAGAEGVNVRTACIRLISKYRITSSL